MEKELANIIFKKQKLDKLCSDTADVQSRELKQTCSGAADVQPRASKPLPLTVCPPICLPPVPKAIQRHPYHIHARPQLAPSTLLPGYNGRLFPCEAWDLLTGHCSLMTLQQLCHVCKSFQQSLFPLIASADWVLDNLRRRPGAELHRPQWEAAWKKVVDTRLQLAIDDEEIWDNPEMFSSSDDGGYGEDYRHQLQDAIRVALIIGLDKQAHEALEHLKVLEQDAISDCSSRREGRERVLAGPLYEAVATECQISINTAHVPRADWIKIWFENGSYADDASFASLAQSRASPFALREIFKLLLAHGVTAVPEIYSDDDSIVLLALRRSFQSKLAAAQWKLLWRQVAEATLHDKSLRYEDQHDKALVALLAVGLRGARAKERSKIISQILCSRDDCTDSEDETDSDFQSSRPLCCAVLNECKRASEGLVPNVSFLRAWFRAGATINADDKPGKFDMLEAISSSLRKGRSADAFMSCVHVLAKNGARARGEFILHAMTVADPESSKMLLMWVSSWRMVAKAQLRWAVSKAEQFSGRFRLLTNYNPYYPQCPLDMQVAALIAAVDLHVEVADPVLKECLLSQQACEGVLDQCRRELIKKNTSGATQKLMDWLSLKHSPPTRDAACSDQVGILTLFADSSLEMDQLLAPVALLVGHGATAHDEDEGFRRILRKRAPSQHLGDLWLHAWSLAAGTSFGAHLYYAICDECAEACKNSVRPNISLLESLLKAGEKAHGSAWLSDHIERDTPLGMLAASQVIPADLFDAVSLLIKHGDLALTDGNCIAHAFQRAPDDWPEADQWQQLWRDVAEKCLRWTIDNCDGEAVEASLDEALSVGLQGPLICEAQSILQTEQSDDTDEPDSDTSSS